MNNYNLDFKKVFNHIFSDRELTILNCFKTRDVDIDLLKQYGTVDEIVEDVDGITYRTVTFNSHDNTQSFQRVYTYMNAKRYAEKVRLINSRIDNALKNEDYLLAAKLKKEKIKILEETDN